MRSTNSHQDILDRIYILCFDYKKYYWKNFIFYDNFL